MWTSAGSRLPFLLLLLIGDLACQNHDKELAALRQRVDELEKDEPPHGMKRPTHAHAHFSESLPRCERDLPGPRLHQTVIVKRRLNFGTCEIESIRLRPSDDKPDACPTDLDVVVKWAFKPDDDVETPGAVPEPTRLEVRGATVDDADMSVTVNKSFPCPNGPASVQQVWVVPEGYAVTR